MSAHDCRRRSRAQGRRIAPVRRRRRQDHRLPGGRPRSRWDAEPSFHAGHVRDGHGARGAHRLHAGRRSGAGGPGRREHRRLPVAGGRRRAGGRPRGVQGRVLRGRRGALARRRARVDPRREHREERRRRVRGGHSLRRHARGGRPRRPGRRCHGDDVSPWQRHHRARRRAEGLRLAGRERSPPRRSRHEQARRQRDTLR